MKNIPENTGATVQCRNVSLHYGKSIVLEAVDLDITPGTIHCCIGPNGGGKTSLITALLGQTRHSGSITIQWHGTNHTIGYVPQSLYLDKTMPITVKDFLALCIQKQPAFLGIHTSMKEQVEKVLSDVQMQDKALYQFSELSGGERQRVLFAQALVPEPGLLILDEPMNSIDKAGAGIFAKKISELAQKGTTILWVHHDLAQVRAMADCVTCINRRILFSGTPQDVMDEKHLLDIFSAPANV